MNLNEKEKEWIKQIIKYSKLGYSTKSVAQYYRELLKVEGRQFSVQITDEKPTAIFLSTYYKNDFGTQQEIRDDFNRKVEVFHRDLLDFIKFLELLIKEKLVYQTT